MPIFTKTLPRIGDANPAVRELANHIRYLQEQLEWTLTNLDSSNINEINTDQTNISSSTTLLGGNGISIKGKNGEKFEVGINPRGEFVFTVNGQDGAQMLFMQSGGNLILTEHTTVTIDGGEW